MQVRSIAPSLRTPKAPIAAPQAAPAAAPAPKAAAPQAPFSFKRALGHFFQGFKAQGKAMFQAIFSKPLLSLGLMAASAAVMLALPMVGISATAVGNLMLVAFTGMALFRVGKGAVQAVQHYRAGDTARAEASFESVGRGGFDLAMTLGPAVVGKALSILKRTEGGMAVASVFKQTKLGQALSGAGASVKNAVGKVLGPLQPAAATEAKALTGVRGAIANSAPVRGFNHLFETIPHRLMSQFDGWAITKINYSKTGERVRDWGLAKMAESAGSAVDPKAIAASRELAAAATTGPTRLENFGEVSEGVYRGAAPRSEAEFAYLVKEKNVKTIVSLLHPENPKEIAMLQMERQLAAKYGVELINLPLPFGVEPPAKMVAQWVEATHKAQAAAGSANVYVHCRLGRDRTGTMVAVHRMANQGLTGSQALAEMRSFGFNPERDTYLSYLGKFVLNYGKKGIDAGLDVASSAMGFRRSLATVAATTVKRQVKGGR